MRELYQIGFIENLTSQIVATQAEVSSIAVLRKLLTQGKVDQDEEIICVVTRSELKDLRACKFAVKIFASYAVN